MRDDVYWELRNPNWPGTRWTLCEGQVVQVIVGDADAIVEYALEEWYEIVKGMQELIDASNE